MMEVLNLDFREQTKRRIQKENFRVFVVGFAGCPVVHSWVVFGGLVECATEDKLLRFP